MSQAVDLRIDVSNALDLGEPVHVAATVVLPDPALLPERPVVCFAKPGGSYSRFYFTHEMPGPARGAQAEFHAARGWIFAALDNLGSGDSSQHASAALSFAVTTSAARAAEQEILLRLANGILVPGYPPVLQPVTIGMGQSTGGSLTIVEQARHQCFDGLAILGFSAVHSNFPAPPGEPPVVAPWFARDVPADGPGALLNPAALASAQAGGRQGSAWRAMAWSFHYDDVPRDVVEQDLDHHEDMTLAGAAQRISEPAPWNSYSAPNDATRFTLTPGVVAPEAAAVTVPVLSAMGERDLVVDPLGEARAFRSAASFDLFVCPRMGHMHNFAGTRALMWERIHHFGEWCRVVKTQG